MEISQLKKLAAEKAVEEIESGMIIGLGTGSTFQFALEKISEKIKSGELKNIVGIPSSKQTEKKAAELGVPVISLNELYIKNELSVLNLEQPVKSNILSSQFSIKPIDLAIDGADEIDTRLNLIKGGGGALLKEKIIAQASKRLIIAVDETKLSKMLGSNFPLPIEVIPFAKNVEKYFLESLGAKVTERKKLDGSIFITDVGNIILDAKFNQIENVEELSMLLNERAGIVEHGLFIGMTEKIIYATKNGEIKNLGRM